MQFVVDLECPWTDRQATPYVLVSCELLLSGCGSSVLGEFVVHGRRRRTACCRFRQSQFRLSLFSVIVLVVVVIVVLLRVTFARCTTAAALLLLLQLLVITWIVLSCRRICSCKTNIYVSSFVVVGDWRLTTFLLQQLRRRMFCACRPDAIEPPSCSSETVNSSSGC